LDVTEAKKLSEPWRMTYSTKKNNLPRLSPRILASPVSERRKRARLKQNMGLYKSPRIEMVKKFFQKYDQKARIPVAEILPVILMNYGEVEFQEAQKWFEERQAAPGRNDSPSLVDVGAGFGPAGLVFGSRQYRVTAVEVQPDIAALGQRVANACGLQEKINFQVTDVMAYEPRQRADTLIAVLCLLHISDKKAAIKKLAALVRDGGRAYVADFYMRGELSARERVLLKHEVACPGLLDKDEYIGALKGAGFKIIRFEDVTSEYSVFVHNRLTTYLQKASSEQFEELSRFFTAMDILYHSGAGESSALGGCRIYLEK
jgi:SAM-dependent methyltransferase